MAPRAVHCWPPVTQSSRKGTWLSFSPATICTCPLIAIYSCPRPRASAKPKPNNIAGVNVEIIKSKIINDGLDEHLLRLDCQISNNTDKPLDSIDFLSRTARATAVLCAADWKTNQNSFYGVDPYTKRQARCYFQVEFPKLKRTLIWLDHHSRQICYRERCP